MTENRNAAAMHDPRLAMVRRVARLMDEQFKVGGFRFGIDPILNLIPVAGDLSGYVVSVFLIFTMLKHGVSGRVAAKMLGNATLDALIGAIPVLGNIFDFTYKANKKNLRLLEEHYTQGRHQGSARPYIWGLLIAFIIVLAAIAYLSYKMLQWVIHWSNQHPLSF